MTATDQISPLRRFAISFAAMTATLMQVLDTSIANVTLPHMQAALGASQDSVTWVLTSYIIAMAVMTPLTGSLENWIGRRRLFTLCVGGFTIASALCGAAPTLVAMVAARILQGMFGALLLPLSQAVLLDIYPPEGRARAITIWSMGTMIGPISGPFVGGWLTDSFNWRWVFYVNVPFGIVATTALWLLLAAGRPPARRFDAFGFTLLATAFASFQLMLDRGTLKDWFHSTEIVIEAGVALAAFWMFAIHTITARAPLIPRALFRDRNFMTASGVGCAVVSVMYCSQSLLPPMLQTLLHYDTEGAGTLMMPRGIGTMAAMLVAGRLGEKIDHRFIMAAGLATVVLAQFLMTGFDLQMDWHPVVLAGVLQGVGMGLVVIPLTILAFSTTPSSISTDAAAVFALVRNLSGSMSIAIGNALLARNLQVVHADLGAHVTEQSLPLLDQRIIGQLGHAGGTAAAMVDAEVNRQAMMIAYINDYWLLMWAAMLALPLVATLRRGTNTPPPTAALD